MHSRRRPGPPRVRNHCRKQAVRHSADAVAARDALHAERRPSVRDAPTCRKGTRVRQKGRTPHGKHRNAARPISRIACRPLRSDRLSGSGVHRSPADPMRRSGYHAPRLESHINAHESPTKAHNEDCCRTRDRSAPPAVPRNLHYQTKSFRTENRLKQVPKWPAAETVRRPNRSPRSTPPLLRIAEKQAGRTGFVLHRHVSHA